MPHIRPLTILSLLAFAACAGDDTASSTSATESGGGTDSASDAETTSGGETDTATTGDATDSGTDSDSDTDTGGETTGDPGEPFYCGDGSNPEYGDIQDPEPDALLWSSRGGWALWDWCLCRPDDAVLPQDPRSMIQPGVSEGRNVAYNAFWKDCHVDPIAVQEEGPAKTCGELRARVEAGAKLMTPSAVGSGALFSGTEPENIEAGFGIATFPASSYNLMWTSWGLFSRPNNFDELVAERVGSALPIEPNPYPLIGEDPNKTDGGSGKLPMFFTQLREPDGTWTGTIGITCHGCHSGQITGSGAPGTVLGGGSPLADHNVFLRDMLPLGYLASAATILNLNRTRGVNNASDINLAFFFPQGGYSYDVDTLLGLVNSGTTAGMDTPNWWNVGHRALKFVDGVFPMDSPRVDMVFYTPFTGILGGLLGPISEEALDWMRKNGPPANDWISILKSPEYPFAIDENLAKEGATLFHNIDLWAPERDNPIKNPDAGNGSCAACHGAYAPLYFNDPAFVASPRMEGVASYITPIDVIGTDPVRLEANNEAVQKAGAANFFGYPETYMTDQDCGPQNRPDLAGDREPGYLAPPLFGVWASAPYFHNGSVPNVWEVLKPSERKSIWKRWSTPPRPEQAGKVVMGHDTNINRAYDKERIGWFYDEIECSLANGVTPYIQCNPNGDDDPLFQELLAMLFDNVVAVWNVLFIPPLTMDQMENRKIYNTFMYGQGNEGHEFTAVLTDYERTAIMEYLKTL
ncbi:MAG: hypothetical protein KC486_13750 [Myxococcales bacterium]|nr:hypothetical protein [Myxococcales bacterium]